MNLGDSFKDVVNAVAERGVEKAWQQHTWPQDNSGGDDAGAGEVWTCANKQSHDSKMTLERLLVKALSTREEYQKQLFWNSKLGDVDLFAFP